MAFSWFIYLERERQTKKEKEKYSLLIRPQILLNYDPIFINSLNMNYLHKAQFPNTVTCSEHFNIWVLEGSQFTSQHTYSIMYFQNKHGRMQRVTDIAVPNAVPHLIFLMDFFLFISHIDSEELASLKSVPIYTVWNLDGTSLYNCFFIDFIYFQFVVYFSNCQICC